MANRNFKPGAMSIEKGLICLYGRVVFGGSGTIASQDCRGFSVAKGATGVFEITLEDSYTELYNLSANQQDISFAEVLDTYAQNVDVEAKRLDLVFGDGTQDTDPLNGSTTLIEITLKNSTVKY